MSKLKSRKLWVAIGSVISIVLADTLGVSISPEAIAGVIVMASTYVFSQGLVDKSVVTAQVTAQADVGRLRMEVYAKQLEAELGKLSELLGSSDE